MIVACLDMEGVLFPEIWISVSEKTGIEELRLTTRDISDYDELMQRRLKTMRKHNLKLKDIQDTIATMEPFPGALEFLDWLRDQCQVLILSDTFEEFAKPIMKMLKMPTIFCHSLEIDADNAIVSYNLRVDDAKRKTVSSLHDLNFKVIAAGDSFNDLGMLKEADSGIFFRPPPEIAAKTPQFPVTCTYSEFKERISEVLAEL